MYFRFCWWRHIFPHGHCGDLCCSDARCVIICCPVLHDGSRTWKLFFLLMSLASHLRHRTKCLLYNTFCNVEPVETGCVTPSCLNVHWYSFKAPVSSEAWLTIMDAHPVCAWYRCLTDVPSFFSAICTLVTLILYFLGVHFCVTYLLLMSCHSCLAMVRYWNLTNCCNKPLLLLQFLMQFISN